MSLRTVQKPQVTHSTAALGSLFKQERLKTGRSLESVASYLEISPENLSAYEQGLKEIPLQHVYGLSNCLGVSPDLVLKMLPKSN